MVLLIIIPSLKMAISLGILTQHFQLPTQMHLHLDLLKSGILYDCVLQKPGAKAGADGSGLLAVPGFQFLSPADGHG